MGLIAAKPVKPCDGGVLGALNLLLKKRAAGAKSKAAQRALAGRCCWLAAACPACPRSPALAWRRSSPKAATATAGRNTLFNALFLAPALIAPRPVKPCDRGVFEALNLLLKKELA